jgi:hypothetical protein
MSHLYHVRGVFKVSPRRRRGQAKWPWHFAAAMIHRPMAMRGVKSQQQKSAAHFFTMSSIGRMEIQSPRAFSRGVVNLKLKRHGKISSILRA